MSGTLFHRPSGGLAKAFGAAHFTQGGFDMSRHLTRLVSFLTILSMAFLAACGSGGSDAGGGGMAKEQVLNVGRIPSEPPSLDPLKATDNKSGLVLRHVMEGLTRMGEDGKPQPAMAEEWEVNEDA